MPIYNSIELARNIAGRLQFHYRPNMLRPDYGKTNAMQERSPKAGQISSSIHGLTHGEKLGELLRQAVFYRLRERHTPHVDPSTISAIDPVLTDQILGLIDKRQATPSAICNSLIARLAARNSSIDLITNGLVINEWQIPQSNRARVLQHMREIAQELACGIAITQLKDAVTAPTAQNRQQREAVAQAEINRLSGTWKLDMDAQRSLEKVAEQMIAHLENGDFEVRTSANGHRYLRLHDPESLRQLPTRDPHLLPGLFETLENQLHTEQAEFLGFLYRRMVVPDGRSTEEIAEHMIITRKIPWLVEPNNTVPHNHMRTPLRVFARLIEEQILASPSQQQPSYEAARQVAQTLQSHVTYAEARRRSQEIEGIENVVDETNLHRDFHPCTSPFEQFPPPLSPLRSRYMTLWDVDYRVLEGYLEKFLLYYNGHPAYYYMGMPQSGRNLSNNLAEVVQAGMDCYWGYTLKVDSNPKVNAVLPWGAGMCHDLLPMAEDSEWIPAMNFVPVHRRPWQWLQTKIVDKISTNSNNPLLKLLIGSKRTNPSKFDRGLIKLLVKAVLFLNPISLAAQLLDVFVIYPIINALHENAIHHLGRFRRRQEINYGAPIWYQPISSETRSESEDMGTAPHHLRLVPMASRYSSRSGGRLVLRRSAFVSGKAGHGSNADSFTVLWNTLRARWTRGNQSIRSWVLKTPMSFLTRMRFRQRIDYWSMQLKRVFFLSMPPAFAFLGITPVAVSNWYIFTPIAALGYIFGMGTYIMEMRAQGKSFGSCIRSIVLDYYGMLQGLKSSILGRYLNERQTFVITGKKQYATMRTPISELGFECIFLGLNTAGGVVATALGVMSLGMPFGWLMFATAFWAFHNSAFIAAALFYLNRGVKIEDINWINEARSGTRKRPIQLR